jgi:hypothetical protein
MICPVGLFVLLPYQKSFHYFTPIHWTIEWGAISPLIIDSFQTQDLTQVIKRRARRRRVLILSGVRKERSQSRPWFEGFANTRSLLRWVQFCLPVGCDSASALLLEYYATLDDVYMFARVWFGNFILYATGSALYYKSRCVSRIIIPFSVCHYAQWLWNWQLETL